MAARQNDEQKWNAARKAGQVGMPSSTALTCGSPLAFNLGRCATWEFQVVPIMMRGQPGFRETFDTDGERVGFYVDKRLRMLPTCRGTIHYGRNGAHIIPARPLSAPDDYCPNKPCFELVDDIGWCIDRALRGQVAISLRALSFLFDVSSQIIMLKAEVDRALSEDEREELRAVESEISADNLLATGTSLRNQTVTELVVVAVPVIRPLDPLPDGIAFLRAGERAPRRYGGAMPHPAAMAHLIPHRSSSRQ